jgi:tRNA uridine 5-carbamoylmethylation protein Kti12
MLLCELFDDGSVNIIDQLRALMKDVLTPLAANKVPHVTVQQVVDRLQEVRSGARVDRAMVMTVLDPNKVELVDKIEGDLIYLTSPAPDEVAKREEDEEADKQKVQARATQQAQKEVTEPAGGGGASAPDIAAQARAELSA